MEFTNLNQGGTSVLEYFLKFTKLSKYAPSLVSDPRDEMSRFVTRVLDNLKEECHSDMLHDNMNIYRPWFMLNKWKRQGLRGKVRMQKRQGLMIVVLQMVSLISMEILGSRIGFLIKFLPNFPRLMMIVFLTLSLKREEVLAHQTRSKLVESVARRIMVIALFGKTIALGLARVATRLTHSAHFLSIKVSYSAEEYAKLYVNEIVMLHRPPS